MIEYRKIITKYGETVEEGEKFAMEYNEKINKSILRKMTFNKIIKEFGIKLKYVETLKFMYIGDNYIYCYL